MDVKSNLQLAYEAEGARFLGDSLIQKPNFEIWKREILEEIAAGKIIPRMRKARITPTSKGEVAILGYTRDSTGCEKANRSVFDSNDQMDYEWTRFTSGYVHYILTVRGGLLRIPGSPGGVSSVPHELLLYAGKPYFVRGGGKFPPNEIYAFDQYVSVYDTDPEKLDTDLLCQFLGVQDPSSKKR